MIIARKREQSCWSTVWSTFEEIRECGTENKDTHFVRCTCCLGLVYKPTSNTNPLRRHKCPMNGITKEIKILHEDKLRLKLGAAKFVSKDLRPYYSVECTGLLDLCTACMEFGQSHRRATRNDLERAMPSRNTVKSAVQQIAKAQREKISLFIKKAIETGGVAATTDTWCDDYRKSTYISVVAHLSVDDNQSIEYHRFVLSCSEITEIVKTGTNTHLKNFYIKYNNVFIRLLNK